MPVPSVIAIDGPTASGKSTVGRLVARRLGYRFVDTGLMYRAITHLALRHAVPLTDEPALGRLAAATALRIDAAERVYAGGEDVTLHLRAPAVDDAVSLVSRVPVVRDALVSQQRRMAEAGSIVMAGRDIGTNVLPKAAVKVYLEASVEERARRRYAELPAVAGSATLESVRSNVARRDALDSQRPVAPLRVAGDALVVQTGGLTVAEVVDRVLRLVGAT